MKALVLAGGRGKRLDEVTETCSKPMLLMNGLPLIEHSLRCATNVSVQEIVIVVGYRAEDIINAFGNSYRGTRIRYVIQRQQRGLVHAMECAQDALAGSDFFLFLADEVLEGPRHADMLQTFYRDSVFALCGIVRVQDLSRISATYAVIQNDGDGRIYRLVEKPRRPLNNIMGTGNCLFRNRILSYIAETPINQRRGEKELPDLIQCAIDDGEIVKSSEIGGQYINVNTVEDILAAENALAVA